MFGISWEILTAEQCTSSDMLQHLGRHFLQIPFLHEADHEGGIVCQYIPPNIPEKPSVELNHQSKARDPTDPTESIQTQNSKPWK